MRVLYIPVSRVVAVSVAGGGILVSVMAVREQE